MVKFAIPYFYIWFKNKLYYYLFWKFYCFILAKNKKKSFNLTTNCFISVLNKLTSYEQRHKIVKLNISNVLKRKYFFQSFSTLTTIELKNKIHPDLLWLLAILIFSITKTHKQSW